MPLMRSVLDRLLGNRRAEPVEAKASAAGALVAMQSLGEPVWSPRNYASFAVEGFQQNAIVHRSVRMVAEAAASIPLILYEGDDEIEAHPLLDVLGRPSVGMTSVDLLEQFYGFLLVSGNAYMEAVAIGGEVRELHALRPDRMRIVPGPDGWPAAWEYEVAGRVARFADDIIEGVRPILHLRLFHPTNDHYGLSPIEAAATAIDIHNEASRWNKALLDNSARPSGALVYAAANGQMTGEQFERLKRELEVSYQGAAHAGRPLLLEGGLDWKPLSLTPKDMDFIEAKHGAAREIALAIGVPPMLLGIPGDNTYSNYQEASRALWRQTVLPLVGRTARALSAWLAPAYGGGLELRADLDQVEALAPEREALWARLEAASFLTEAEKRAAAGYGEAGGTGEAKFSPDKPRLPAGSQSCGRWTSGNVGGSASGLPVVPVLAGGVQATVKAALALFAALSQSNSDDGAAILEFNAREFLPGATPSDPAIDARSRTREEVDQACPRHGEVQSLTDAAADTVRREGNYIGAAAYSTKVHTELKRQIDALRDPDFRAEVSTIKSNSETRFGAKGSIRVDVFENVRNGTVCVYDIKTGERGLSLMRMTEIANNVHSYYPGTTRILVIETRPGK